MAVQVYTAIRSAKNILPLVRDVLSEANKLVQHVKGDYADELVDKVKQVEAILAFLNDVAPNEPGQLTQKLDNAKLALSRANTRSSLQWAFGGKPDFRPEVQEMEEGIRQLKVDLRTRFGVEVDGAGDLMTAEGLLKLARQASGDLHNQFFYAAAELDQGNLDVWYEWGCRLAKSEKAMDWKDAISRFKSALECRQGHPETLHEWGLVLKKSGGTSNLQKARDKLWEAREQAFKAKKGGLTSIILTDLANVLSDQGHETAATMCLKEAILYDPKNVKAFWKLGELLALEEEYEKSHSTFESAAELDKTKGCPVGLAAWGRMLFERSQLEEDNQQKVALQNLAEEKCKRALESDEQNDTALHFWGEVLAARKCFKEAAEKFEKANEAKESRWTVCRWAMCLCELQQYEGALKMLQDKLKQIEGQRKVLETGKADEDELETHAERQADVLKTLGLVLKKQGKKDAARQRFKDAVKFYKEARDPDNAAECLTLASSCGSSDSPASSSPEAKPKKAASKQRYHYERSWSKKPLNRPVWDAFKDCPQPLDLTSVRKLYKVALQNNNKVDPTERRVFEYILSPETPVQVLPAASDFLKELLKDLEEKTPRTRDRSRSRRRGRA
ncbi:yrrB_13 [Symbiodinium sp. CCMP2592]|nr:yrrB_13 [Symbiodinium sp. CCMP2592]